jgi:DNA-directed RNA polymerase specialized sigma24 family protein
MAAGPAEAGGGILRGVAPKWGGVDLGLVRALAQLSEAQRTTVVMHHLGGWPTRDIAVVLGCADVTVRSHLSRGRQRLAELLGGPNAVEVNDGKPT